MLLFMYLPSFLYVRRIVFSVSGVRVLGMHGDLPPALHPNPTPETRV